jgi:hypothetical protein
LLNHFLQLRLLDLQFQQLKFLHLHLLYVDL